MPDLLAELKAKGYKVVHLRAKTTATTLAHWDEAVKGEIKGPPLAAIDRRRASCARSMRGAGQHGEAAPQAASGSSK